MLYLQDMTGGILEENLSSLHLKEGSDYYHFNWLLQLRKKGCATRLLNLVSDLLFLLVPHLKRYQWPEPLGDPSVQYGATAKRHLDVCKDISDQQNTESKHVWKQRTTLLNLSGGKFSSVSRNVWKRNKLVFWKSISQPGRNTVATQRNGLKPQWTEQQWAKIPHGDVKNS